MTKHSHFPYTSTYSFTPHNTNRKHNIHHIHYTNILQHPKAKKTIVNNDPHIGTTADIKINMCHIHIVSRHQATRGNNKILRTPPPHISSSKEILPRLTRRTLAKLRTNKSPFLKSYLHKVDTKSHPSPLFTLCNTHTHNLFNCTHIHTTLSPLDLWTDPAGVMELLARWGDKLAGGPKPGGSDSPPQTREWVDTNNKHRLYLSSLAGEL